MKNEMNNLYPDEMVRNYFPVLSKMIYHRRSFPGCGYELMIKPLWPERDVKIIHQWAKDPYASQFCWIKGSLQELRRHYEMFMTSGHGYSFMCFMVHRPMAHFDLYHIDDSEIKDLYDAQPDDHWIRIWMAPGRDELPRLSVNVMITCLSYLFTLSIDRVIMDPDVKDEKANKWFKLAGFQFIKKVSMPYRQANLYCYDRNDFLKEYPYISRFATK